MKRKLSIFSTIFIGAAVLSVKPISAQITVPLIKDYMVISRTSVDKADIKVSGICVSGTAKIKLDINGQDDGAAVGSFSNVDLPATIQGTNWSADLTGLPVGGEYKVKFKALNESGAVTDSVTVQHILVGDVWLASGQSNLQQQAPNNTDTKHVHVRLLYQGSGATVDTIKKPGDWSSGNLTGPCNTFGMEYYKQIGVPIGILLDASGGTSINDWFAPPDRPLFNRMRTLVDSTCGFRINGFLWYQGENEDQQDTWALRYFEKFIPLRDTVRSLAKNPKLPILAVQLESWDGGGAWPLPPERQPRWPIIRDRQELIGAADSFSATVPAWDFAGLHINSQGQGTVGVRAAQIAATKFFGKSVGTGPRFKKAWFQDQTKTKLVVQFKNVKGRITSPNDPDHLGFYVMKTNAFDINDSTIFNYGTSAKMLLSLKSVTTLDTDKVVIELNGAQTDSITVGYGRNIKLAPLSPVTDNSGIPLCTFFNREIFVDSSTAINNAKLLQTGIAGISMAAVRNSLDGRLVLRYSNSFAGKINISLFSINGKKVSTLFDGYSKAGAHELVFARLNKIHKSAGALYICRLSAGRSLTTQCLLPAIK